jgi:hypothetical protein
VAYRIEVMGEADRHLAALTARDRTMVLDQVSLRLQ